MKKILITVLCCVLCLMSVSGCGKKQTPPVQVMYIASLGGESRTHKNESTATSDFLVKDGRTDYAVLYSADASSTVMRAVGELTYFFNEATGISLSTVSDANYLSNGKYLSVGKTALFEAASLAADPALLGKSGAQVRTVNRSVFMCGAFDDGTLYSVYEFLRATFGYEFYSEEIYDLQRNVTDCALQNYDILEVPDIETRLGGAGYSVNNELTKSRMRLRTFNETFTAIDNHTTHNSLNYLPPDVYKGAHPDWYAANFAQLCYTAHGKAEEYAAMVDTVVDYYKTLFSTDAKAEKIFFCIQDNQSFCACAACSDIQRHYNNSPAAAPIIFLNDVLTEFETWLAGDGAQYKRDYNVVFLAYHGTIVPPTVKEGDTYRAIDEKVIPHKRLMIYFAETNADYTYTWEGEASSLTAMYREYLEAWAAIANGNLGWWLYRVCFANYMTPYNCFNGFDYYYKLAKECGVKEIFNQADLAQSGSSTCWGTLKGYLDARLSWNVNYNVDYLIDKFFTAHFGAGATQMREMFDEWLAHSTYQRDALGVNGSRSVHMDYQSATYWPRGYLERGLDAANAALVSVTAAGGDLQARYAANVRVERIGYEYLYLYNYAGAMQPDKKAALAKQFKADVLDNGISLFSETKNMTEGFAALGI